VAVAGLGDVRGLRAAMRGVDVVYHLSGTEQQGARARLYDVDVRGTLNMAQAAADAQVDRFFYVSHLSADRASAYPLMKAKGIAEDHIRKSGAPYTIFRTALLYGPEDHFTTAIARLAHMFPVIFVPSGAPLIQPLWVEDLVTCMLWSLDKPESINQSYDVGGGEYFSFTQVVETVLEAMEIRRIILPMSLPSMRAVTVLLEYTYPRFPTSTFWVDYLSINRTCAVDSIPRAFGFIPSRFAYRLDHLKSVNWLKRMRESLTRHEKDA
jgi:NADH dehydrogenase